MGRPGLSREKLESIRGQAADRVLAILEAGETPTITNVSRGLGLSPMALYRYFPAGKEELTASARALGFRRFSDELAKANNISNSEERIVELARLAYAFARANPRTYQAMYTVVQPDWESSDELVEARKQAWSHVGHVFDELRGRLCEETDIAAHGFTALVHGVIMYHLSRQPQPERQPEKLLVPAVKSYLRGIRR